MKIVNFRYAPYILLTLAAGLILAAFYNVYIFAGTVVVAISIIFFSYKKKFFIKALIGAISIIIGLSSSFIVQYSVSNSKNYSDCIIEGRVTEDSEYTQSGYNLVLDNVTVEGIKLNGRITVVISPEDINYVVPETGYRITFQGGVTRNDLDMFSGYSVKDYRKKLYYTGSFDYVISYQEGLPTLLESIRARIKEAVYSSIDDEDTAALSYALISGNRNNIDFEIIQYIGTSGIAHVFAVSGLHVAILAGALYYIFKKLKVPPVPRFFAVVIPLILYIAFCGFTPSVVRAVLMSSMVMFGTLTGRRNDMLSIVSLSAIIILLFKPVYLLEVSFLMSYAAVFGIILLFKPISRAMQDVPEKIRNFLVSTLSANIALFPVISIYFNTFSLYFLLANLIILPAIGLIFIILLSGTLLAIVIPQATFVLTAGCYLMNGVKQITFAIGSLPYASIAVGSMGAFAVFYYICVILSSDYVLLDKKSSSRIWLVSASLSFIGIIYAFLSV
jgi:competence protein ComEC